MRSLSDYNWFESSKSNMLKSCTVPAAVSLCYCVEEFTEDTTDLPQTWLRMQLRVLAQDSEVKKRWSNMPKALKVPTVGAFWP